jgi:hypothetical protein
MTIGDSKLRHINLQDEELRAGHCALMDWSSFRKLMDTHVHDLITQPFKKDGFGIGLLDRDQRQVCDLLVRLIVYDCLVLDGTAGVPPVFSDMSDLLPIVAAIIPQESYSEATDAAARFIRTMRDAGISQERCSAEEWFQGDLKARLDELAKERMVDPLPGSDRSLEQTVFNIQLAHQFGMPVFLSYAKRDLIAKLKRLLVEEAFPFVEKKVNAAMASAMKTALADATPELTFEVPPLYEMVIRTADRKGMSLLQAVLEIRASHQAQEFRDLLAKVQRCLADGGQAGRLAAEKQVHKLTAAARGWAEAPEPVGEERWKRTGKLSAIPVIGWVAELFGLSELPFSGRRLTSPPGYVEFVGQWFQAWPDGKGPLADSKRMEMLKKLRR